MLTLASSNMARKEALIAIMKKRGYNKQTLATKLNVSRTTLDKLFKGRLDVNLELTIRFARIMGITVGMAVGEEAVSEQAYKLVTRLSYLGNDKVNELLSELAKEMMFNKFDEE